MGSEMTLDGRPDRAQELLQVIARRIRDHRERQGMTQEDFASRCGISVSFASLLERGERSPSYETLVEVGQALQVSLSDLMRDPRGANVDEPAVGRLLDFARRRKLNRSQLDRLIAVAEAMFAEEKVSGLRGPSNICGEMDCGRAVLARGLCTSHYHRARRAKA
jgi:transcriptional regulator with XRE-family HTH domain